MYISSKCQAIKLSQDSRGLGAVLADSSAKPTVLDPGNVANVTFGI